MAGAVITGAVMAGTVMPGAVMAGAVITGAAMAGAVMPGAATMLHGEIDVWYRVVCASGCIVHTRPSYGPARFTSAVFGSGHPLPTNCYQLTDPGGMDGLVSRACPGD
jgi:hypothetical protein